MDDAMRSKLDLFFSIKEPPITPDVLVSLELQDYLKQHRLADVHRALACVGAVKWLFEIECEDCGDVIIRSGSKTLLSEYLSAVLPVDADRKRSIRNKNVNVCDACAVKRDDARREHQKKVASENADAAVAKYRNALDLITGEGRLADKNSHRDNFHLICNAIRTFSSRRVAEWAEERVDYHEYICSEWWRVVSREARRRAKFKCQLCAGGGELHTHHKTYDHLYVEATHMDDLIVLCADCHEHHHDQER